MPARHRLALLALCLGYLIVILDATIVNVALPAIGHDLRGGVSAMQWVLDAYTIVFAGFLLAAGGLCDRLGARPVFEGGLAWFALTTAACGAAPSTAFLVGARVLQGAGAAALVPSSLALLRASYPEPAARARALGAWGGVAGIGAVSGPVLGGLLTATIGWRAVFLVAIPVAGLALWLCRRHVHAEGERVAGGLDPAGQVLGTLVLTLVAFGTIEGGGHGLAAPPCLAALLLAVPALAGFVAVERRARHPMLPLALFGRPTFAAATLVGFLINFGLYGQLFVFSLYFQRALGYSALAAGAALVPETAAVLTGAAYAGRAVARHGPRRPMLAGLSIGSAGFAGLMAAAGRPGYVVLVAPLALTGFGMSITMPSATAAIIASAPPERAGIAAAVLNAARQAGSVIGIAVLGALVAGGRFGPGLWLAMGVACAAFLAGLLATGVAIERRSAGSRHHGG